MRIDDLIEDISSVFPKRDISRQSRVPRYFCFTNQ